ncbi:MAG: hypothetical protein GC150_15100 [Rhizobiales bacterium]|nr:hypothetical protein [Hyphomicrobiales bacterium]
MLETILVFVVIIALGLVAAWFLRGYLTGNTASPSMFGGGRERRLGVVETANVDGRRKLVLLHRDGVEHLIMTGGPIDVIIETGIGGRRGAYERQHGPNGEIGEPQGFGRARVAASSRPIEP